MAMRPLEKLPTIRGKLGSVIVIAVGVTVVLIFLLLGYAFRNTGRDTERLQLLRVARVEAAGELDEPPRDIAIVRMTTMGVVLSGTAPPGLPAFDDGGVHVGKTATVDFAAVPVARAGSIVEMVYAVREIPDTGFLARMGATFAFLGSFWWQFLVAGALASAIAVLMARWLARGMTQPLRDMASAARRMEVGDYSVRVHTRSRDEVGQLATAFNRMSTELENLEQSRRDLVANVSHELKTPIAAIRAHLENLLDGVEHPDPQTLEIMLGQTERLGRLVEALLDLSRLESGEVPLHREEVPVGPLVSRVVSEIEVARPSADVTIGRDIDADLPALEADAARVHQVLFNLVDNAVRFTPPGGAVTIAAHRVNGHVEISVADTGSGIPPEALPRLFERFYRVDTARSREDGGTGIGLAIARSIVEAHGGHIHAASRLGSGSVFTFDLPAARTDRAEPEPEGRSGHARRDEPPREPQHRPEEPQDRKEAE
jgi:signal transduction histidine kinase